MNRRNLVIGGVILLVLLWGGLLYRDMRLGVEEHEEYGTAEVVLRGLDLEREVSGDLWTLHAEKAERYEKLNRLESIRVTLETVRGDVWLMEAPEGTATDDGTDIRLFSLSARLKGKKRPVFWTAPLARWDGEAERWFFPEGIRLWSENVEVEGATGTLHPDGRIRLEKGATVSWQSP
ncbi:MAG: hypothetical protein ACP5DY_06080 [Thermovirgaceae bacterium]